MQSFKILKATRENILKTIDGLTVEQLNKIPTGFNNNIAWNLGHLWVTQQLLCYRLSGMDISMENEMVIKYRKGSKPEEAISASEIEMIKNAFLKQVEQLETDFKNDIFKEYKTYMTSYNVELSSTAEAISFNNVHEALHLGSIMALKHLV